MKKHFITVFILLAIIHSSQAQNSSPYWSVAGNSNASSTSKLGTTNSVPLRLFTNNIERLRIDPTGKVGIGTTTPATLFHVKGIGAFGNQVTTANSPRALNLADNNAVMRILRVHASYAPAVELISRTSADGPNVAYWDMYAEPKDASFRIRDRLVSSGPGMDRLTISHGTGFVGIGTATPAYPLDVVNNSTSFLNDPNSGRVISASHPGGGNDDYIAVYGESYSGDYGQWGIGVKGRGGNIGVYGESTYESGVYGTGANGVYGIGYSNGILGESNSDFGNGVAAYAYGNSPFCYGLYASSTYSYAGYFDGDVYASGIYQSSDRKLKQNITDISSAMSIINKLQPKSYDYRQDGNFKLMNLPKGKHFGLIAQDVEQVLPNLVKDSKFNTAKAQPPQLAKLDSSKMSATHDGKMTPHLLPTGTKAAKGEIIDFKAVNYIELIPLVVKGMQEQQQQIVELRDENKELRQEVAELKAMITGNNSNSTTLSSIQLEQNTPNPVTHSTTIHYSIPAGVQRADLLISDYSGKIIKSIPINSMGSGTVNIDASLLSSGAYNYSIVVGGRIIVTKKMIVSK